MSIQRSVRHHPGAAGTSEESMPVSFTRPLALAATLALVAGSSHMAKAQGRGNAAPAQAAAGPAADVLDGELEVQYEDYAGGARLRHYLHVNNGRRLRLEFPGDGPELLTGTRVRAHGRLQNDTLTLASSGDLQAMALASADTFGEQKVIVILVNFSDVNSQPYSAADASAVTFQSTSDFYRENSYQQTWLSGNVYGWYTIPMTSATCDSDLISGLADQAATNAGVDLSQYTRKVYAFPQIAACGWWGLGTVGGNPSRAWVNGSFQLKVVAHELGHNYGDFHSHSLPCDPAGCSMVEYGDDRDMMGGTATGHFTAFQKERLGWLNYGASPGMISISQSGSYFVEAYAAQTPNPKALKILKEVDVAGQRTWYYVEARAAVGFDGSVTPGVVVHTGSDASGSSSNEVDLDPATTTFDSTLDPGQTFTDAAAGVSITTAWAESTGAMLNIVFEGPACAQAVPTVSISPAGLSSAPARPVNYTVTVKNNDGPTCDTATFGLSSVVPAGWSGTFNTASVSLAPGASSTAALTVTSAAGADGPYTFQALASRSGASGAGSQSIRIISSLAVTVSAPKSGNGYQLTATVLGGGAPVSGANVAFTVTSPNGTGQTLSATTSTSGVAKVKYTPGRKDPAGTYTVQAVAASGGLSGTATTSFVSR
jgi:hypothetical protein